MKWTMFSGHLVYALVAFVPMTVLIYLSLSTAPDRPEYLYYLSNPEAAVRIEPGFVLLLDLFKALRVPPDISLTVMVLMVVSLCLHCAFLLMRAPSAIVFCAVMVFLLTVFVTPTLIQVRFGLAVGLALWGYAMMRTQLFWGSVLLVVACTMHVGAIYFVVSTFTAYLFLWVFKGTKMRILLLLGFMIGPTLVFKVVFSSLDISTYYQLYFSQDYGNVVISLSAVAYCALMITYLGMRPPLDHTMVILFSGLGMLFLVLVSGFAVFHRLYFPAIFVVFCFVTDTFFNNGTTRGPRITVIVFPVILIPISLIFASMRLDLI